MPGRNVTRIAVTEQKLDDLARMLRPGRDVEEDAREESLNTIYAIEIEIEVDGEAENHLTDDQIIDYHLRALPVETQRRLERHLKECAACAEEVARDQAVSNMWIKGDEPAIQQLTRRVQTVAGMGADSQPAVQGAARRSPLASLVNALLPTSIYSLRRAGAYAEAAAEPDGQLEFPISENGTAVAGLHGKLVCQGRDFFIKIDAEQAIYGDRLVRIAIWDQYPDHKVLERNVEMGVTVPIGTGLKGFVTAELCPIAEERG